MQLSKTTATACLSWLFSSSLLSSRILPTNGVQTAQHFPSRVDQYRSHQTSDNIELVKTDCHTDVVLILGGYTSLAQRMDECVNTIQGGNMAVLGGVDQKAKDPH